LLRKGITLEADAHLKVPLELKAGRSVTTVEVTADVALLNTESGSSGQVLTTRQVEQLPVSGSSPTWLALIAPGTQGQTGQAASTGATGGLLWTGLTQDFGTFGQIGINEFSLDGGPNETNSRQAGINLSPDEVGEMKFDVTGYDPAVGHTMGVSVTQTTKAGTNDLHGAVRELSTGASMVQAPAPNVTQSRTSMETRERTPTMAMRCSAALFIFPRFLMGAISFSSWCRWSTMFKPAPDLRPPAFPRYWREAETSAIFLRSRREPYLRNLPPHVRRERLFTANINFIIHFRPRWMQPAFPAVHRFAATSYRQACSPIAR